MKRTPPLRASTLRVEVVAIKRHLRAKGERWGGEVEDLTAAFLSGAERMDANEGRLGRWEDGTEVGQARALTRRDVRAMVQVARRRGTLERGKAEQLVVMWKMGLRVSEATRAVVGDVSEDEELGWFLRIKHQKNKRGFVHLAIPRDEEEELDARRIVIATQRRRTKAEPLFTNGYTGRPTMEAFRKWVKATAAAAKLSHPERVNTHSARAGFCVENLINGVHLETILHRGRWASRQSMAPYLRYPTVVGIRGADAMDHDIPLQWEKKARKS
jgi:integrase